MVERFGSVKLSILRPMSGFVVWWVGELDCVGVEIWVADRLVIQGGMVCSTVYAQGNFEMRGDTVLTDDARLFGPNRGEEARMLQGMSRAEIIFRDLETLSRSYPDSCYERRLVLIPKSSLTLSETFSSS